jgi:hypothetical protein
VKITSTSFWRENAIIRRKPHILIFWLRTGHISFFSYFHNLTKMSHDFLIISVEQLEQQRDEMHETSPPSNEQQHPSTRSSTFSSGVIATPETRMIKARQRHYRVLYNKQQGVDQLVLVDVPTFG